MRPVVEVKSYRTEDGTFFEQKIDAEQYQNITDLEHIIDDRWSTGDARRVTDFLVDNCRVLYTVLGELSPTTNEVVKRATNARRR